jgi:hypothetical protein
MVAKYILGTAMVCGVLFATDPVYANDEQLTEGEKFAVISFAGIDADELVSVAKKLGHAQIVRIPLFNAVMVWGTDEELADIKGMLRPL